MTIRAESLFSHMKNSGQYVYGFQFGNEPGHWYTRHYPDGPNATQLGNDLVTLRGILDSYFPDTKRRPVMFGPDNCGPGEMSDSSPCGDRKFFSDIITNGREALSGITVHHYGEW